MGEVERIIKYIMGKRSDVSRDYLLERLKAERVKAGGLISDAVLLRMIAADLGVEVFGEAPEPSIPVGKLVPGLNDVTVTGRVLAVFPTKAFGRKFSSKIASLLIADESGVLRVVLWNDKSSFVEDGRIKAGQIVRLLHGYTKEGLRGKTELHMGGKGEIQICPEGVEERRFPTIEQLTTRIGNLNASHRNRRVNLVGRVREKFQPSTFERRGSETGKVMHIILADETGEVPVVVWNEKVEEVENLLGEGEKIQIVNAKVKKGVSENLEIHIDSETYIEKVSHQKEFLKIADLKEGMEKVNVKGEIATKPMVRTVKTGRGEKVNLAVFEIKDETGKIWVTAWRKHAEKAENLKKGEKLEIKNAYVKRGFGDQLEITTRKTTTIEILSKEK
ncbi:MAG: OB-fold nucleic acid binding domain-containing protein [Candidatus Bathyarchaeia archaeon]